MVLPAPKGPLSLSARRVFCLGRGPPKAAAATTRGVSTAAAVTTAARAAAAEAYAEGDRYLRVSPQQQQQQQQQRSHVAVLGFSPLSRGALQGVPSGAPLPACSSVQLPAYVRELRLGGWQLYFYPLPQYLKSADANAADGPPGGPLHFAWEGASLVPVLQPQLLCLECCSSRLQQLIAAAAAVAAAARRGVSLREETQKQQRRLAKGFSLLTAFDGGLLHAALLPVVVAAATMGGPLMRAPVPIDRDRVTTARRLHELLLLQPTQLRALRVCVLQSLSRRWLRGPPDPVGGPQLGAPATAGEGGAPQWALQQKESFPAGYQVLLEERASCAATALWNAMRVAEEETVEGGTPGGPHERTQDTLEGTPVGLVFCSAALLPLLMQSLQQLHAAEAPKAAAAAAAGGRYRSSFGAALHQSPPCLLPLLVLRFLLLPAAAAYGIAAAVSALSSWLQASLHRGDPPAAAAAAELRLAVGGAPGASRGPLGAPTRRQPSQEAQTTIL